MPPRSSTPDCGKLQGPDVLIAGGRESTDNPRDESSSGQCSEYLPSSKPAGLVPPAPRPQARKRGKPKQSIANEAATEEETKKLPSPKKRMSKKPQSRTTHSYSLPSSPLAPKETPEKAVPRSTALGEPRGRKRGANSDLASTLFKRVVAPRPKQPLSSAEQASSPPKPAPKARAVRDVLNVFDSDPLSSPPSDGGSLPNLTQISNSQEIFDIVQFSGRPGDTSDTAPTSPVGRHIKMDTSAAGKTGSGPDAASEDVGFPSMTATSHGNDGAATPSAPASESDCCSPAPRASSATGSGPPPQQPLGPKKPRVVFAITSTPDTLRKPSQAAPNFPPAPGLPVEPAMQESPVSAQAPRPIIIVPSSSSSSPDPSPRKVRFRPTGPSTSRSAEAKKKPPSTRLPARNTPRQTQDSKQPSRHGIYTTSSPDQTRASPGPLLGGSLAASGSDDTDGPSQYQREVLQTISRIIDSTMEVLNRKEAALDMVTSDFEQLGQTVDRLCRMHQREQTELIFHYRKECDHVVRDLESACEGVEQSLQGPDSFDFDSLLAEAQGLSTDTKRLLGKLGYHQSEDHGTCQ
ncbi:hypothetical protein RB595_008956 [Gaeumannomyces hyphopodioides]